VVLSPVRVEALGQLQPVALAAAKFHSAALGHDGRVWTWGWGRGGRTGAARSACVVWVGREGDDMGI
jgi:alpha-tubulin suppressor-like RCC1 family protein